VDLDSQPSPGVAFASGQILSRRGGRRAFTLIELLVVIAIIGVLAGLLLPVFQTMMIRSRAITCASNMRLWGTAYLECINDNNGMLPQSIPLGTSPPDWEESIAPYVVGGTASATSTLRFKLRSNFGCPSDPTTDWVFGNNNYLDPSQNSSAPKRITGLPNRVNVAIMADSPTNFWGLNAYASSGIQYTRHAGQANFCFGDGHVESLNNAQAVSRPVVVDFQQPPVQ
jgi:prepilin-type N-terminal cleavage/methylation domain-containing protein/prepilin-type processing-associated H-X9-DG protein